jgi:hypothetical protein
MNNSYQNPYASLPAARWYALVDKMRRLRNLLAALHAQADAEMKTFIDAKTGAWMVFGVRTDFEGEASKVAQCRTAPVSLEDYYHKEADWLRGKNLLSEIFHRAEPCSLIRRTIATSDVVQIPEIPKQRKLDLAAA